MFSRVVLTSTEFTGCLLNEPSRYTDTCGVIVIIIILVVIIIIIILVISTIIITVIIQMPFQ